MTEGELHWMAGFFEGEGCVLHYHYPGHTHRGLEINSTDLDVLERWMRLAECGDITPLDPRNGGKKMNYRWRVVAWADTWPLLVMLEPLMGRRRRTAMRTLLADPPRYKLRSVA